MYEVKNQIHTKMCVKAALFAIFSVFCFTVKNGTYILTEEKIEQFGGWWPAQLNRMAGVFVNPSFIYVILFFLFVGAYLFLMQRISFSHCRISIVLSVCYALFLLLGESYFHYNNWDSVFGNGFAVLTSFMRGAGIGILFFFALQFILNIQIQTRKEPISFGRIFLVICGVFVLCWLPYMIIMFPGAMNADTRDQVAQITGTEQFCFTARMIQQNTPDFLWNNNHPVLFTLILKCFVMLGGALGSYAWGFEIYSVLQSLAFAMAIAYLLTKLRSYGCSRRMIGGFVAFFALNPLFPLYGMTIMKDIPFTIALVFASVWLYEILSGKRMAGVKECLLLSGVLLVMMLFRNNGFFMMILAVPFLIVLLWREKKKMLRLLATFLITIVVFKVGISGLLFPALGIGGGSTGEMLSVPFQQTARYITEYRDEITAEEEQAILGVLNTGGTLDEIADLYEPYRADMVKQRYNPQSTGTDLKNYVVVWAKQFVKHPDVYVQAYLNLIHCWFGMEASADNIYYMNVDPFIQKMLDGVIEPESLAWARNAVNGYMKILDNCPMTSWLLEFSVYTWAYIILLVVMVLRRKRDAFLTSVMLFVNYLTCLAGPVGYMRYAIPMIVCLPLVIVLTFYRDRVQAENREGD